MVLLMDLELGIANKVRVREIGIREGRMGGGLKIVWNLAKLQIFMIAIEMFWISRNQRKNQR